MNRYQILGVYTGKIQKHSEGLETAIRKSPQETLFIKKNSLDQDEIANTKYHGGEMRVVHHYSLKNYNHLKNVFPEIADRFVPGSFGENILTEELTEADLNIGDIYSLGTAKVQLTVSRRPCATINHSYQDNRILKEVMRTGRTGWFYRVLKEGEVRTGDYLTFLERPFPDLPVSRLCDFSDLSFLRRCLQTGLMDKGWKPKIENALLSLIAVLLLTISSGASALETDNYIVWDKTLKNSSSFINDYLSSNIQEVVNQEKAKNLSCESITKKIFKRFQSRFVHDNPVENYLLAHLPENYIYPQTFHYVERSIYQDPFLPHIPQFGLAPNIQVNGYYFGTDKLSHFASVGYLYFAKYLKEIYKGTKEKEAERKAINYGIRDERTLHGYWASGVFSYADLEANYQGFLFYRSLCIDQERFLENVRGSWVLNNKPRIEKYVDENWDESYNLSYRLKPNWKKVLPILQRTYCLRKNPRLDFYKKAPRKSFSRTYLEQVKNLPVPQTINCPQI